MHQHLELMVMISLLETSIPEKMKAFENSVRTRWSTLPNLEENTVYHRCPYFGDVLHDELLTYFRDGIMRIASEICCQFNSYSGKKVKLSWFGFDVDYEGALEEYCIPFEKAFESASAGGIMRLKQARAQLAQSSVNRRYGYVTNSFATALTVETINAVGEAMRSIENDKRAWRTATAPQQRMHNQLVMIWSRNFESKFMELVKNLNKAIAQDIIESFCRKSGFFYETYLEQKESADFEVAKNEFNSKLEKNQKLREEEKMRKQEELRKQITLEIEAVEAQIASIGFSLFGEKRKNKKALYAQKEQLLAEEKATFNPVASPSTYIFFLLDNTNALRKISNEPFVISKYRDDWTFEYNKDKNTYIAIAPDDEPLFYVSKDFVRTYGRDRDLGGRFEAFLDRSEYDIGSRLRFIIYDRGIY